MRKTRGVHGERPAAAGLLLKQAAMTTQVAVEVVGVAAVGEAAVGLLAAVAQRVFPIAVAFPFLRQIGFPPVHLLSLKPLR